MKRHASYIGFRPLPKYDDVIEALVNDPPDIRWRWIRAILRIEDPKKLAECRVAIENCINRMITKVDWRVAQRLRLAFNAVQRPVIVKNYILLNGKGAFSIPELEAAEYRTERLGTIDAAGNSFPLIDFHVHPKIPDLKFLSDMRKAGISYSVILATDTDPENLDRAEIINDIRDNYARSSYASTKPLDDIMDFMRSGIYSQTHVTNQDVADWVKSYPDILIGFGSVDLCKSSNYVQQKLFEIEAFNFKGIKLLPYSQFFNPSRNKNMNLLFDHCRRTGAIVLTHTGCAAGAFELPELSENSRPAHWEPLVRKYPEVPLVLAHFGSYSTSTPGIWFQEAFTLMKNYQNVYADISAAGYILKDAEIVNIIRKENCFKQVLFATDYPGPLYQGISTQSLVDEIKTNHLLSESEKQMVLGENAGKLLGIENQ